MQKYTAFGFDVAITILEQRLGVATRLKKISSFITSIHYIAHRTNLAALEATKTMECKFLFVEIDCMVNSLRLWLLTLKNLEKKCTLDGVQKELNDVQKTMKGYYKVRLLFRF